MCLESPKELRLNHEGCSLSRGYAKAVRRSKSDAVLVAVHIHDLCRSLSDRLSKAVIKRVLGLLFEAECSERGPDAFLFLETAILVSNISHILLPRFHVWSATKISWSRLNKSLQTMCIFICQGCWNAPVVLRSAKR